MNTYSPFQPWPSEFTGSAPRPLLIQWCLIPAELLRPLSAESVTSSPSEALVSSPLMTAETSSMWPYSSVAMLAINS